MIANFILKPDMIEDEEAINFFVKIIYNLYYINIENIISVSDWTDLSKVLYEDNSEQRIFRNLQLIRTILTYKEIYKNNKAKIIKINFNEANIDLDQLYQIKKTIRNKFVYNKPKYYINIKNINELDLNKQLSKINLNNLIYIVEKTNNNINDMNFKFAYLNYIHFPDPNIESINDDNIKILRYMQERKL